MEKKLYELRIDPELESTARALRSNERDMLIEDIQARGCIAPLIVWEGIIVDGHNRYRICHEHNIPFGIEEVAFESKTDARIWIITNQLSRRNLSPFEKCELALSMEKDLKELAEQRRREAISRSRQTGEILPPSQKTRDLSILKAARKHDNLPVGYQYAYAIAQAYNAGGGKGCLQLKKLTIHMIEEKE